MARSRYSKNQQQHIVNSYNAAINRAKRSDKLTALEKKSIPDRVNMSTLAKMTSTKDRDRMLDYMQLVKGGVKRFKQREIAPGVTASQYQLDKAQKQVRHINYDRAKRRKALNDVNENIQEYRRIRFKPETYTHQEALNRRLGKLEKQYKQEYINKGEQLFMENYRKALQRNYGVEFGNAVMDVIEQNYTPAQFIEAAFRLDLQGIPYVYTANQQNETDRFMSEFSEAFDIGLDEINDSIDNDIFEA